MNIYEEVETVGKYIEGQDADDAIYTVWNKILVFVIMALQDQKVREKFGEAKEF